MTKAIETINVVKTFRVKQPDKNFIQGIFKPNFKKIRAVNGVSLEVKKDEIFGLLGPNGSGKTTLIRCLTGIMQPDEGSIYINNKRAEENKGIIGLMLSQNLIYPSITGYDNLKFYAKIYGIKNIDKKIQELAEKLEIQKYLYSFTETYSLGTRVRLAFARAMINDPEILFLDEPTIGLDPIIAVDVRNIIKTCGKTVFLTTHYMEEAEELCDRISIINNGKIIITGTAEQLKKTLASNTTVVAEMSFPPAEMLEQIKKSRAVLAVYQTAKGLKIIIRHKSDLAGLLRILSKYNITKITEEEATMEDVFVKYTEGANSGD